MIASADGKGLICNASHPNKVAEIRNLFSVPFPARKNKIDPRADL